MHAIVRPACYIFIKYVKKEKQGSHYTSKVASKFICKHNALLHLGVIWNWISPLKCMFSGSQFLTYVNLPLPMVLRHYKAGLVLMSWCDPLPLKDAAHNWIYKYSTYYIFKSTQSSATTELICCAMELCSEICCSCGTETLKMHSKWLSTRICLRLEGEKAMTQAL